MALSVLVVGCGAKKTSSVDQLTEALDFGRVKDVERILAEHPKVVDAAVAGETSLLVTACQDCPEAVPLLIEYGFDVNQVCGSMDYTPLTAAIGEARPDIVAILLKHGADPMKADRFQRTPVEFVLSCLDFNEVSFAELEQIAHMLKDAGGRPISAIDFESCPDGTEVSDVHVIPDYVELDESQQQAVAAGSLLPVRTGAYLSPHPFAPTSGWHFCPESKIWDRTAPSLDGFKRKFPTVISEFHIPENLVHQTLYRQTLLDGEVHMFEFELTPTGMTAGVLQRLAMDSLKEQGVVVTDNFVEATDAVVELDDTWTLRASVFGEADSTNTTLWLTVLRSDP